MESAHSISGAPSRSSWLAIALLAAFCTGWSILSLLHIGLINNQLVEPTFVGLPETNLAALPPAPDGSDWDNISGLNIVNKGAGPDAVVTMTAVGSQGSHTVDLHKSFAPGTTFRLSAEVQPGPKNGNFYVEARDSVTSTGRPTHYIAVSFDLVGLRISGVSGAPGDSFPRTIDKQADGWIRIRVEHQTADGQEFLRIALLDDEGRTEFRSLGQQTRMRGLSIVALPEK